MFHRKTRPWLPLLAVMGFIHGLSVPCLAAGVTHDEVRLLFASQQNRRDDIYSMRSDGSDLRPLTNHAAKDCHPAVSADGRSIVFSSERVGWWKIWAMDADGRNVRQLTDSSTADYFPSWFADGSRIAFASERGGSTNIWTMAADGSDLINLTESKGNSNFPAVSPDGRHIAFASDRQGTWDIFVMDLDGKAPRQLTSGPGEEMEPAWFPDGSRLVYQAQRPDGRFDLQAVEVGDDHAMTWLTESTTDDRRPTVSPDGAWIAFEGRDGRGSHIFLMKSDGSARRQLTDKGFNYGPAWFLGKP